MIARLFVFLFPHISPSRTSPHAFPGQTSSRVQLCSDDRAVSRDTCTYDGASLVPGPCSIDVCYSLRGAHEQPLSPAPCTYRGVYRSPRRSKTPSPFTCPRPRESSWFTGIPSLRDWWGS
ncbi:hypothetical protein DAEQUDRAFT_526770 [Daedalea quercina L-15889]|uniref:Uncharacterized protein n=1 Tax=Daedalea quercina L-15889 TaxID=1314783 RepID=A0A165M9H7_9APHY|nr:hypothetical protein DAEQUDRAFT_526770 [Daedalea quercina L-15889]